LSGSDLADGLVRNEDDVVRCWWGAGDDAGYRVYHDDEWGMPVTDDVRLFEKLCLEGFQAGLAWITILRKRERFREVFAGFDPEVVASFGPGDVDRLLTDPGIIRHRGKIEATIANARATLALRDTGTPLPAFVWSHRPEKHRPPRSHADWPTQTPESVALSKALRKDGFRFVGPTTAYAAMQACGIVNDHLATCPARKPTERALASARLPV